MRQLFNVVVKVANEINETSFVYGKTKRRLVVQPTANASEFYVPNMLKDRIVTTRDGSPDISGWADIELVNNKPGWESLGIVNSCLLLGMRIDHMGVEYPKTQTIAGVEIDCDSEEYQAWYQSFTKFPLAAISEAQHQISEILNIFFDESNRCKHQKKSYFYATER